MLRRQLHDSSRQRADEQQQQQPDRSLGSNYTGGADFASSVLGLQGISAASNSGEDESEEPTLLGRLHQTQSSRKTPKMDLIPTHGSPRFVKRSAHMSEQSRYDAVGYPKSTRVSSGLRKQQSAATLRSPSTSYIGGHSPLLLPSSSPQVGAMSAVAEPQSRLKGFEMRVVNTHSGKAVVRAPILRESTAAGGSRKGHRDDVPELPPPSAAELRYNAQRALISTTAVLRSAIGSKVAAGRQHATIGVKVGGSGRRARRVTRTMSDQAHALRSPSAPAAAVKEGGSRPADRFHISMQFASEADKQLKQPAVDASGYSGLEQGRASSSSMLEQWGISTTCGADDIEHWSDLEGSDAERGGADHATEKRVMQLMAGEGPAAASLSPTMTTMARRPSTAGPDGKRGSQVALSDESQKLIESIFSGRLSIGNSSDRRFSREDYRVKADAQRSEARSIDNAMSNKRSPQPAPQHVASDSHSAGLPERDGAKMRKPSFWSMFRGANGLQRREPAADEKRDSPTPESSSPVTHASTTASGRQHFLKKQQSSSSGFAESFGLSKLLTLGDNRYGAAASTGKALPPAPPLSPPLPPLPPPTPLVSTVIAPSPSPSPPPHTERSVSEGTPSQKPAMALVDNHAGPPDTAAAAAAAAAASAETGGTGDCSGRLSGSFYTPMQEFFGVSASAGDPTAASTAKGGSVGATPEIRGGAPPPALAGADSGAADLVQGADSQSGFTPADSPAVPQRSALDSGAGSHQGSSELANGPADDDTDSDIIPLSQSRVLIGGARRGSESAGPDVSTLRSTASNGLGIAHSHAARGPGPGDSGSICSAATRLQALSIPYSADPAAAAELEGTLLSAGRLRFSPDAPPRVLGLASAADDDNETEIDIDIDGDMDDGASSALAQLADESSQQACAMGKYLYDIEEYWCQASVDKAGVASGGEPLVPRILQGIAVPALADHAEWLGKREVFNGLALRYYIGNYDFCGLRIDECLRRLCSHIFLRGESQVIDRLLVALAQRFVACNPDTKLRTVDVAHAVTYSTLLLNTDLHIADIRASDRMTKSRFVRNTIDTVAQFQSSVVVLAPDDVAVGVAPQLPELDLPKQSMESANGGGGDVGGDSADGPSSSSSGALRGLVGSMASLQVAPYGSAVSRTSRDVVRLMGARGKRFSFFESSSSSGLSPGPGGNISAVTPQTPGLGVASAAAAAAAAAVSSPSSLRAFDRLRRKVSTTGTHTRTRSGTMSMDEPVPLPTASTQPLQLMSSRGSMSAAPEGIGCGAPAVGDMPNLSELSLVLKDVYAGIKAKPLGQPLFARQSSLLHENSKHSLDVRPSSVRSMPMHSAQRTRSINSMNHQTQRGRPPHHPDLRLGEAVKRAGSSMLNFGGGAAAGGQGGVRASPSSASMGYNMPQSAYSVLMRSPIENQHIRSGVLVRKHLFERAGKKASSRAWRTCYVSVDRGTVAMYKMDGRQGAHPDGRELTDTSLQLGSVSLRHTMTHMLPSPGYSRSRPHVFALQLPSGGVYLFQTASEVELRDWVAACNYWAARESKAPYMIGGVYNMEYGWDNTGDYALRFDEREAREDRGEEMSAAEQVAEDRRILEERDASKGASILEWTPPNNPMQRSDLDEAAQLKSLLHHITYLEEELVSHKKVQGSIEERFYPRTQQFQRGFSNWERKAQYILQELIKYQSYADVLQKALKQMQDEIQPIPEEPHHAASDMSPASAHPERSASPNECQGQFAAGGAPVQRGASCTTPMSATGPGFSASRASLPQAVTGRRTLDLNGNPTPSKSLPIKELLAPASEKARNRASIISPNSVSSSSNTVNSSGTVEKHRVSVEHHAPSPRSSTNGVPLTHVPPAEPGVAQVN